MKLNKKTLDELAVILKADGKASISFDELQIERITVGTKITFLSHHQPIHELIVEHSHSPGCFVTVEGFTGSMDVKLTD